MVPCSPGYYSPASSTSCTICPAGFLCDSTQVIGSVPATDWAPEGMGFSVSCEPGTICSGGVRSPCADGTYRTTQATCEVVPDGYAFTSASSEPMPCPAGYYSTGGAACQACPFGSRCPLGSAAPVPCTSSELCLAGSSEAVACPSYMDCSSTASILLRCAAGEYRAESGCVECPASYTCSELSGQVLVGPGYYSPAGSNFAFLCPAGHDCSSKTEAVLLQEGWYSAEGGVATECPVGSACPDPASPSANIDCASLPGYYQDAAG
jgi:hypothetical protein